MKNTINFLLLILLNLSAVSQSQDFCGDKDLPQFEQKFMKAVNKGKADTYDYPDMAFRIAECYRLKNDTTSLSWYRRNISVGKRVLLSYEQELITESSRTIGQLGISSYYIGEYFESIRYLEKLIGRSKVAEYHYFLGLSYMKLQNYAIARVEFNNFKQMSADIKDVESLIENCNNKLKDK